MMQVKILIVDDSNFIRQVLKRSLEADRDLLVIGEASDGYEALDKIRLLKPDVVTLDVEMPGISGLETLRRIMTENPVPVVMLSAHTTRGADATMEALAHGAVDFVAKPELAGEYAAMIASLKSKIRVAAKADHFAEGDETPSRRGSVRVRGPGAGDGRTGGAAGVGSTGMGRRRAGSTRPDALAGAGHDAGTSAGAGVAARTSTRLAGTSPAARESITAKAAMSDRVVVIGCSTGGPAALHSIIPALPANLPVPIVIVQHIPVGFSASLAEHLALKSPIEVKHAEHGDEVRAGRVLMAPAGFSFTFKRRAAGVFVDLRKTPAPPGGFSPSVDKVMKSASDVYGRKATGVLLTGMGRDGVRGMMEIKNRGGTTIAEHESTCVVYGMPKAAYDARAVNKMLPLDRIAAEIIRMYT